MADYSYILYDTAVFGAVASAESILFQLPQGADATHTEAFTNMRGAAQLPVSESFTIDTVAVHPDHALVNADIEAVWRGAFLQLRVADQNLLWVPLVACAWRAGYGGHFGQAAAANLGLIGREGDGFKLAIPIVLPGGTAFRVRVVQGPAVTAASNMKVDLIGTLSIG